jgi:hypothetical protein
MYARHCLDPNRAELHHSLRVALWLVVLVVIVSGCGPIAGSASPKPVTLGISNGTALTVGMFVNGQPLATFAPGSGTDKIDTSTLPALPWDIQARSTSGRVLTSMNVTADQVQTTVISGGVTSKSGSYARVDLSCGTLRIWAGDITPSGPAPDPSAGHAGDCIP